MAEVVHYIRGYVRDVFGQSTAGSIRVIYGGSTVPEIVNGFLDIDGLNGFLVGGASLNYHAFSDIVNAAHRWQREHEVL